MSERKARVALIIAVGPSVALTIALLFTTGTTAVMCLVGAVAYILIAAVVVYVWEGRQLATIAAPGAAVLPADDVDLRALTDGERGERATSLDLGVRWDQDDSDAWLVQRRGDAALILRPHRADEDRRLVVLVWTGLSGVLVAPVRCNAKRAHRLYDRGLRECEWSAEVHESSWIAQLPGAAPRHFVVLTKEQTVEIAAERLVVRRVPAVRFADAASAADLATR